MPAADLADLQLADLVGQGLAGPGDVAVDLVLDLVARQRRVLLDVVDGPGATPSLLVHAGVDHEAGAAEGVVVEPAEVGVGVGVEADLARQPLAVECPALVERREVEIAAERRPAWIPGRWLLAGGGPGPPRDRRGPTLGVVLSGTYTISI